MAVQSYPPFGPTLFLGFALRAAPLSLIQKISQKIAQRMQEKYPTFGERLSDLDNPSWLINPIDLPFAFLLKATHGQIEITAHEKKDERPEALATIHASIANLLKMMNGDSDGDALFFTRDLEIEGSTEAVVALRNAIDATGVDLGEEILEILGPLSAPAKKASNMAEYIYQKAAQDMHVLQNAVNGHLKSQIEQQADTITELNQEVMNLKATLAKAGIRQKRTAKRTEKEI
ncbi:MAG: SCP2 domain-containing protein [Alphaproteobacteria bacterium]